jgi:restriction endonuclease S subunit
VEARHNQDIRGLLVGELLDPEYLLFLLRSSSGGLHKLVEVTGLGVGKIDASRLAAHEVPVPSLSEQKSIAEVAALVERQLQLLSELERMYRIARRALMGRLLGSKATL